MSPRRTTYLLSGLLVCGECGASMVTYGGSSARYYRCNIAIKRGTCKKRHSVREDVTRTRVLEALRYKLMGDESIAYVHKGIADRLGDRSRVDANELTERTEKLRSLERKIENLIELVAEGRRSEYVDRTLKEYEEQARVESLPFPSSAHSLLRLFTCRRWPS